MLTTILLAQTVSPSQSNKQKERSEIKNRYKWKTGDLFVSDTEWEKSYNLLRSRINELEPYRGKLDISAEQLLNCLKIRDELEILVGKLSLYANLKSDEDTRVTRYQGYREQISGLQVQLNQKKSFIQPEILAIPQERLLGFLKESAELAIYGHYLDDLLRSKAHVLTSEGEQLLALS
ncbi:MAG: oligoendopeptidase F, partial [Calditrichia bacterium]|nr:oligoendopeptidase F [Calditrichia bacterium]